MVEQKKKDGRGGARPGAGRPKLEEETKLYTFRAGGEISKALDNQKHRTDFIKDCIKAKLNLHDKINDEDEDEPDFSKLGQAYPATRVKDMELPYFDIALKAGFPIPMDNDEHAQTINLLDMICPNPEASYLIKVDGDSMIDADIQDGDLVVVDKSNRNPSEDEVAVCQLNGDYTLKHVVIRGNKGWLVPRNKNYPKFELTEGDNFYVWGTVTYIIHRPR